MWCASTNASSASTTTTASNARRVAAVARAAAATLAKRFFNSFSERLFSSTRTTRAPNARAAVSTASSSVATTHRVTHFAACAACHAWNTMGLPATSASGPGRVFERVRGMADAVSVSSDACHAAMTASTRGCEMCATRGKHGSGCAMRKRDSGKESRPPPLRCRREAGGRPVRSEVTSRAAGSTKTNEVCPRGVPSVARASCGSGR